MRQKNVHDTVTYRYGTRGLQNRSGMEKIPLCMLGSATFMAPGLFQFEAVKVNHGFRRPLGPWVENWVYPGFYLGVYPRSLSDYPEGISGIRIMHRALQQFMHDAGMIDWIPSAIAGSRVGQRVCRLLWVNNLNIIDHDALQALRECDPETVTPPFAGFDNEPVKSSISCEGELLRESMKSKGREQHVPNMNVNSILIVKDEKGNPKETYSLGLWHFLVPVG
ncbi:hypothetical protein C8R42DRAFT_647588 [Lentinula raphanica]|nr:hypothetical protein C8R42DRAFT_647588 [Lentinula raphanica]